LRALTARRGALEAIERILNRGGDRHDVLHEVVFVLHKLYDRVAIRYIQEGRLVVAAAAGSPAGTATTWPIEFEGAKVGEIEVAPATDEDATFVRRVATIIAPYCVEL
jgi:hypothetical protein